MSRKPHVAIVGAGIVGSAIGLELAGRGAAVTLVDAGGERASENSFGWINASWFNRPDYFRLRHFSMGAWRRWEARVSGLAPRVGGAGIGPGPALDRLPVVGTGRRGPGGLRA
jgi:glycine/D-amino acid oxidase-like deaminating enzyme